MNQKVAIWKRKLAKEKWKNQKAVWDKLQTTSAPPNDGFNVLGGTSTSSNFGFRYHIEETKTLFDRISEKLRKL